MMFGGRISRKALVLGIAAIGVSGAIWLFANWALKQKHQQRFDANVGEIINLVAIPDGAEPSTTFDMVRRFIHEHSRHKVDAEFRKIMGDANLIAEALISHATGQRSEQVHLECSTRSNLMSAVMRKLGYKTRIVYAFDTDGNKEDKLRSHTFVDVLNSSTGKWESHDADYDIYWKSVAAGDRVSVFETAEDPSLIEPCDGTRCGWDLVSDEGHEVANIGGLIDIVSMVDKPANERVSRFTSRANPKKVFTFTDRKGTFCEIMAKLCKHVDGVGIAPPYNQ